MSSEHKDTIPGRQTGKVLSELSNSIGFVSEEANRAFKLKNGQTALFWHLVGVVQSHCDLEEPKEG